VDITTNDNKPNSTEKSSQQSNTQLPGKQLAENSAATPSKVNTRTNSISTNNNALATEINTLFETDQTLASIEPLPMKAAILPVEEPFVNVQRRPYHQTSVVAEEQQIALQPEELVKEAVTTASITVNKVTANTPLAAEANGTKLTLGSRAIRSLAWVVGKASDERIKIKTTFNPLTGTLAAYEVETANRKWQKQF
jgi:hypothetical protein